mmetsp:Transcript_21800/g.32372  ORF Transcript_21800/g.32372 Transcript_21800/m.32372 type:complete len:191 (-) Transcript_21800:191-763(-)
MSTTTPQLPSALQPFSASQFWQDLGKFKSTYKDRLSSTSVEQQQKLLAETCLLYVGNLSFYTTEQQLYALFSRFGELKRIIMGLDRKKRTPCGFCFIEYYDREAAEDAINILNYTRLDDRLLKIDWDYGYTEKRRFGRGKSGGQVRDEYKEDFDPGRALISLPVTDASAPSAPMTAAAAATTTTTTAAGS